MKKDKKIKKQGQKKYVGASFYHASDLQVCCCILPSI